MGTILDYLKEYGDYSLEEKPFSEVDSLVISQLSYLKFDGIVPGPEEERAPMSLEEIAAHGNYDHLYEMCIRDSPRRWWVCLPETLWCWLRAAHTCGPMPLIRFSPRCIFVSAGISVEIRRRVFPLYIIS